MSSSITLSAATRQNLLSLQDTAALASTTQNRLSTGKKVSSALDSPVNFFTAQALNNRSGDLNSLLDGISNGIQTIQAANQGITSIQKLIDSAKSITTQALASKNATGTTTAAAAGAAYTAAAKTIDFTVNGATKSATVLVGDTSAQAVAKLNAAAGTTAFSEAAGTISLVASSDTSIGLDAANATKVGFAAAVVDNSTDTTRSSLATQYNAILTQISQLANDASFNGVNLINSTGTNGSNKLHISFNETDKSSLDVAGKDLTSSGLGLTNVDTTTATAKFQSDADVKTFVSALNTATNTLRAAASTFGSNLSVVQNRQDFTKQLVNVLGNGASNLTDADLNEEAANSQALTTRQSLGISALSLANQAQQGILQLLR
ncbi:flagellin [Methylobacterium sp. 37f]|uniref:flagellin N-terminal helical domain-containing protein n=1 Tax=Methylobacterium sp. 37f TaxID=2817058 RepID=UPI001FFD3740|nr:flagellin [Methylobacterium sp. 37f]MCK2056936.1 flagellar protein [Methylobacterium sp. 37f]